MPFRKGRQENEGRSFRLHCGSCKEKSSLAYGIMDFPDLLRNTMEWRSLGEGTKAGETRLAFPEDGAEVPASRRLSDL